jgi:hypothetical protein
MHASQRLPSLVQFIGGHVGILCSASTVPRLDLGWLAAPFCRPRLTMVAYRTVNYLAQPDNVWAWRGSGMSLEGEKPDVLLRTPLRCRWRPTLSWIIGREDVEDDGQLMVN